MRNEWKIRDIGERENVLSMSVTYTRYFSANNDAIIVMIYLNIHFGGTRATVFTNNLSLRDSQQEDWRKLFNAWDSSRRSRYDTAAVNMLSVSGCRLNHRRNKDDVIVDAFTVMRRDCHSWESRHRPQAHSLGMRVNAARFLVQLRQKIS